MALAHCYNLTGTQSLVRHCSCCTCDGTGTGCKSSSCSIALKWPLLSTV